MRPASRRLIFTGDKAKCDALMAKTMVRVASDPAIWRPARRISEREVELVCIAATTNRKDRRAWLKQQGKLRTPAPKKEDAKPQSGSTGPTGSP